MDTALTRKSPIKRRRPEQTETAGQRGAAQESQGSEPGGAAAGMPLFLRRDAAGEATGGNAAAKEARYGAVAGAAEPESRAEGAVAAPALPLSPGPVVGSLRSDGQEQPMAMTPPTAASPAAVVPSKGEPSAAAPPPNGVVAAPAAAGGPVAQQPLPQKQESPGAAKATAAPPPAGTAGAALLTPTSPSAPPAVPSPVLAEDGRTPAIPTALQPPAAQPSTPELPSAAGAAPAPLPTTALPPAAGAAEAAPALSAAAAGPASSAGGGGSVGGSSGGDGAAAPAGAEAANDTAPADGAEAEAQEATEERMEGAAPVAAQEDAAAEAEGEPEAIAGGEEVAAAEPADTGGGDGGPADMGATGGEAGSPDVSAESAPAASPADPDAAQRVEEAQEARQEQADSQRVAEQTSDERAEEQAEQQAEAGAGSSAPDAQLGAGEKDAGLASLGESVGGGGEAAGAGGGGGGGGGGPAPELAPAPATAAMNPSAGLAAAASLQPMQAAQALDGVGNAVDSTAQEEGAALQEQMPPVEVGGDGSGGSAVSTAPEETEAKATEEAPAGPSQPTPEAEPLPEPGPAPTAAIATPSVADTEQGTVSREDATRVAGAVSAMPTSDPGLNVSAGPPPALAKEGDADPGRIQEQRAALDATVAEQRARGAADAAAPGGEQNVRDRSPREALQAPRLAAPAAGGAGGAAPAEEEGVGIIAEQKQGAEVRAAMTQAQGQMAAKRAEHQGKVAEEKAKSSAEITALKQENASQQQAEKAKVEGEVGKARGAWTAEQNAELARTNEKARGEISKGNEKISQEEKQANEKAAQHISAGESEAAQHREKAEKEAAARKQEAERQKEEDSGGIFGWIASKVTAFFEALKNAITKVFDAAKKLVKAAIDKAKQLAVAVIEKARQAVVGLIKAVGAALVALGDVLLAAFPGLRRKWRAFIASKVKAAEDAVNRLADGLKKGVTRLLDLVGKAFTFLLDAYSKAMVAVLDVAKGVAMAAIKAAKAYAAAIGTFVVLIKDIAAAPGRWIANLGAAVMDGIRNNLWTAFKTSVKSWFDSKLEQVLGVGTMIWNVLKQGGISFQQVGQMAFQALKAAIPSALIALLIEKLVAMIVPAAGAVMAIIEGLQAAWPAVRRVIAAAGLFVVFLKAVKAGGAGPQFAGALAAGAVVVIDFVANWLLKKLRGPASKVGSKVKAIAQKIMARAKKALKKVGGAVKKGAKWVKGKAKGLKKKFTDLKAKRKAKKDAKNKGKEDPSKKKQDKKKAQTERLERAVAAIKPRIKSALDKGAPGFVIQGMLKVMSLAYRLTSLRMSGPKDSFSIIAKINPEKPVVIAGVTIHKEELLLFIRDLAREVIENQNEKRGTGVERTIERRRGQDKTPIHHKTTPQNASITSTLLHAEETKKRGYGTIDYYHFPLGDGPAASVSIMAQQGSGKADVHKRNQILFRMLGKKRVDEKVDYRTLFKQLSKHGGDPHVANEIKKFMLPNRGVPQGIDPGKVALMGMLFGKQEVQRNVATLVEAPMLLEMVSRGDLEWKNAKSMFPMAPKGAQKQSEALDKHLAAWDEADDKESVRGPSRAARKAMNREINLIQAWAKTLDLKFDDKQSEQAKRNKLKKEIRSRIMKFWTLG